MFISHQRHISVFAYAFSFLQNRTFKKTLLLGHKFLLLLLLLLFFCFFCLAFCVLMFRYI